MKTEINLAVSDEEIQNCYTVMSELRPHIAPKDFVPRVKNQMEKFGFQLVYLIDGEVKAAGGFRLAEWLAGDKYLEIEDLVAKQGDRSKGYGGQLFDWLVNHARQNDCDQLRLVSHVTRFSAHKFYLNKKMIIEAHYFSLKLR